MHKQSNIIHILNINVLFFNLRTCSYFITAISAVLNNKGLVSEYLLQHSSVTEAQNRTTCRGGKKQSLYQLIMFYLYNRKEDIQIWCSSFSLAQFKMFLSVFFAKDVCLELSASLFLLEYKWRSFFFLHTLFFWFGICLLTPSMRSHLIK